MCPKILIQRATHSRYSISSSYYCANYDELNQPKNNCSLLILPHAVSLGRSYVQYLVKPWGKEIVWLPQGTLKTSAWGGGLVENTEK